MFWMMNGMGPRGCRRMHHRGYTPMGGLFLFPGILFGGIFGIYAVLAVLNVAGIVIGAVLSGLASVFSGVMHGIGSALSGVGYTGGLAVGIVIGLALFYGIRQRRNSGADREQTDGMEPDVQDR